MDSKQEAVHASQKAAQKRADIQRRPQKAADRNLPGAAAASASRVPMPSVEAMTAGVFEAMPPGALRMDLLMRMQGLQGNRAVARIVQRDPPTPTVIAGEAPPVPADLQTFRDKGAMPAAVAGTTVVPPGGVGGFQARYDPVGMDLNITMNIGITFVHGITLAGGRAVPGDATDPALVVASQAVNRLPAARRAAEVAKWTWSGDEETWMTGYKANVSGAWNSAGTGLQFQSSHAGWEAQLARVKVTVNTQNVTAPGPVAAGAATIPSTAGKTHCNATIYKTPVDGPQYGAYANGPGSVGGDATASKSSLHLGSGQTVSHGHLLQQRVLFGRGKVTLDADAQQTLQDIIYSFQSPSAGAGTTIDVVGHADTVGSGSAKGDARNQVVSEKRAQAVAEYLKATRVGGNNLINAAARIKTTTGVGSAGGGADAGSRRVDINFAGGGGQNTAAHEFGHMLGLKDQYVVDPNKRPGTTQPVQGVVGGTGGAVGTATTDDARTTAAGLGNSTYENNDNLMSLGNTIRAPQYLTFKEALHTVSGSTEWKVKA